MSTIGFLTSDLMFHSRVSQSLNDLKSSGKELTLSVNRSVEKLIEKLLVASDVKLIIVDLSLRELNMEDVTKSLRDSLPSVPIIAYGPHVAGALLQSAADAGVESVYTRGQFDHRMTEIIAEYTNVS
ncbi:MAG: response regulator [Planctomycetota bacterium]|nr:response regulator [Planctomycetota bacterium]